MSSTEKELSRLREENKILRELVNNSTAREIREAIMAAQEPAYDPDEPMHPSGMSQERWESPFKTARERNLVVDYWKKNGGFEPAPY